MQRLLSFLLVSSILSCGENAIDEPAAKPTEDGKEIRLNLIDSLGTVSFAVPGRYDTTFSWVHRSDCGKFCDLQKYRYQSKGLPVIKEGGLIWTQPKDSVDWLTISHTLYFPFHEGDTGKNVNRLNALKGKLASDPYNPPIVFDTIAKINDRYFYMIAMEGQDSIQSKKVVAVTTIKSNEITFSSELKTAKSDSTGKNFIKNSLDLMKTIRISNGI